MGENEIPTEASPSEAFRPLRTLDEYSLYFTQLYVVFEKLTEIYAARGRQKGGKAVQEGGQASDARAEKSYEAEAILGFLAKMLYTIDAFRKKYTYNPDHTLKVDLTDSGFPSFMEISSITTDLLYKEDRLASLPTLQALKQEMLDHMFRYKAEPEELLCRISERAYYEMLDRDRLFLAFTPGTLRKNGERDRFRSYTISWACYDFATNRPYIHIMIFDQDIGSEPLENSGANFSKLSEYIQAEGSRAPDIGVVALGIDSNIRDIHPKVIKRICIGPVCSKHFSTEPAELVSLLTAHGENEDDFILLFEDEIIFSSDQTVSRSVFSFGQLREIFFIPETDTECYTRKASKIYRHMLLPHTVLQHTDFKGRFRQYSGHEIITYDREGGLYVK